MSRSKLTILLLLACALLYAWSSSGQSQAKNAAAMQIAASSGSSSSSPGQHSIIGTPTLTAKRIDQILCSADSPACNTGQELYDYGQAAGIDPAYALAFFKHESSYGKYGIAATNKGLGNIRCTSGYACLNGFRAYPNWQQGYQDWYALIAWYVRTLHRSTVESIIPVYAPAGDNNDVNAYISSVVGSVESWRASK